MPTRFRLPYTPEQVYTLLFAACKAEVATRLRQFQASVEYKKHIWEIAQWLTSKESTFALYLAGNRGNGKTTIIKALQNLYGFVHADEMATQQSYQMPRKGLIVVNAKDIINWAKAYHNPNKENQEMSRQYTKIKNIEVLCIDDLGTEPRESMHYGEFITAVTDIINHRYDNQFCTITTSNIPPQELAKYYDERIADRFREMAKIVNFGNEPSFRTIHVK